jgi:hypothetical protein
MSRPRMRTSLVRRDALSCEAGAAVKGLVATQFFTSEFLKESDRGFQIVNNKFINAL